MGLQAFVCLHSGHNISCVSQLAVRLQVKNYANVKYDIDLIWMLNNLFVYFASYFKVGFNIFFSG